MTIYVDAATIATKTAVSASETDQFVEQSTVTSTTSITYTDRGPYTESGTPTSITKPAVLVELQTSIVIVNDSGAAVVGVPFTSTIEINVPSQTIGSGTSGSGNVVGGTDTSGGTFTTPTGFWGTSTDSDNGIIP